MVIETPVRVVRRVPFRVTPQGELTLNLFLPERASAPCPVVLFFHGGAWRAGQPEQFSPQATALAEHGFAAASAQYRLSQQASFPAAAADAKAAVRWLRAHAGDYQLDSSRLAVAGGSAGGHLAALVATTGETDLFVDGEHRRESSAAQLDVLFNAVTDLRLGLPPIVDFLGATPAEDPERYALASPITHVSPAAPPTLLLHGTADKGIPFAQSVAFRDALQSHGVEAELFAAEGAGHGFFNNPPWYHPALEAMLAFLEKHWET